MALQIRRGLNQERLNITPLAGEVVFVTDWKAKIKLITAVDSTSDTMTSNNHGWASGNQVMYRGPTAFGLTTNTRYYIKDATTNSFKFSNDESLSSTVNITSNGSLLTYPVVSGPRNADGDVVGNSVSPMWIGDGDTVGGIAVGVRTLDDLDDVEIDSDSDGDGIASETLANEQHLEYDAGKQQWLNKSDMIIPGSLLVRGNTILGDNGNETATFQSPIVSAPNDLNINSGQLFIDQSTGNIGLGDTTPSHRLDVNGNIRSVGDVIIDGGDLTASTSTFNLVNTTATTVNTGGAATTYNIGHSSGTGTTFIRNNLTANLDASVLGNLTITGNTTVNGNTILGNADGDLVTIRANEILLTGSQPFITFGETSTDGPLAIRGIRGNVADDDYWFVGAGSTGQDDGYLEISISDNASSDPSNDNARERIIVRRYGGGALGDIGGNRPWNGAPVIDELELFDLNGYTTIPNRLGLGITPTVRLDVNGSARIRGDNLTVDGNLIVNGTTTTINSTTLTVDDKNIELGSTASPTDAAADGGGITLKGTTDKTILWRDANNWWEFNQSISATSLYAGFIQIAPAGGDDRAVTTASGDLHLDAVGVVRVKKDFVAEGQLSTWDNIILVNSDVTAAPTENAGLFVERGTSANAGLLWNESTDRWQTTVDSSTYINIPNQALDTTSDVVFDNITANSMTLPDGFSFNWSENNDRTARPSFQSTDGNVSGVRIMSPSTATAGNAVSQISVFSSDDLDNGDFFTFQCRDSATDPMRIFIGNFTNGTQGFSNSSVAFYDFSTKFASINSAGPTANTDLITKTYLEAGTSELAQVKLDTHAILDTATLTTSATTANQILDTNGATTYRSVKYQVQITSGTEYQCVELLVVHNGTTATLATVADVKTGATALATFNADISGGNLRLRTTPTNAVTTYKLVKTVIKV